MTEFSSGLTLKAGRRIEYSPAASARIRFTVRSNCRKPRRHARRALIWRERLRDGFARQNLDAPGGYSGDNWDEEWHPKAPHYAASVQPGATTAPKKSRKEERAARKAKQPSSEGCGNDRPVAESLGVPAETYLDGVLAVAAVDRLKKLAADKDEPFLLAVGFHKPHLPFVAPEK